METKELKIRWIDEWNKFVDNHIEYGQLYIDDYEVKKCYPLRQKAMKAWINAFIENYQDIISGKIIMSTMFWISPASCYPNNKDKPYQLSEFHSPCETAKKLEECNCPLAEFAKIWFGKDCSDKTLLGHNFTVLRDMFLKLLKRHSSRANILKTNKE